MASIQTLSRVIRIVAQAGLYLIYVLGAGLFLLASFAAFLPGVAGSMYLEAGKLSFGALTPSYRLLGAGLLLARVLTLAAWLYPFAALFKAFEEGEIFTSRTVHYIRFTGWGVLANAAYALVGKPLEHLLQQAAGGSPGPRLHIGTLPLGYFLIGAAIIVVAHVMEEGRRLKEDQDLVI